MKLKVKYSKRNSTMYNWYAGRGTDKGSSHGLGNTIQFGEWYGKESVDPYYRLFIEGKGAGQGWYNGCGHKT